MMKTASGTVDCLRGTEWCGDIVSPPRDLSREFIVNGCTYETVYRRAAGIYRLPPSAGDGRATICLCTDDKALLAAALVAALAGGPRLVLPYAFSRQAVTEVLEVLPLSFILADHPGDFPPGPAVVTPSQLSGDSPLGGAVLDPDNPFLMLFTGGSTGKPKAWAKTPRNMLAEARHLAKKFGISSDDLFLSTVPPMHIYGLLYSVLVPFICGARVLDGVYAFPREILRAAEESRASVLVSVPAHYRALKVDDLQRHELRMAFSSAGALDKEDAAYFHGKTGLDITEIYGSTETGGVATRQRFRDGEAWKPLEAVDWRIGEGLLHVRSPFISPTLALDRDGFFVTADRADLDGDERFILRGRADDIVKVGGKRVDLAQVQAKLKQIPGVRDAVVIALPAENGRQNEIAALVVSQLDVLQVRRQIAAVSESYAVPRRIALVVDIPLAPTGKYDHAEIERILRE